MFVHDHAPSRVRTSRPSPGPTANVLMRGKEATRRSISSLLDPVSGSRGATMSSGLRALMAIADEGVQKTAVQKTKTQAIQIETFACAT